MSIRESVSGPRLPWRHWFRPPSSSIAAAAMELLGGLNQWRQGNRGPETDSLIDIGTTGLRDYA